MATTRRNDVMDVMSAGEAFGWGVSTCDQLGQIDGDADVLEPIRLDFGGR